MRKRNIIIGAVVLIIVLGVLVIFLGLHRNNLPSGDEINYEQTAARFISENDTAFIEDGHELTLSSKEKIDDTHIKMTFLYKMYSYPEGDQFKIDVIVNTENGSVSFVNK